MNMTNQEKADWLKDLVAALNAPPKELDYGELTPKGRLQEAIKKVLEGTDGETQYKRIRNWYFQPGKDFDAVNFEHFIDFVETGDSSLSQFDNFCLVHVFRGMSTS
jgi:hypothetical protein